MDEASNYLKEAGIVPKEAAATRDAILELYGSLNAERERTKVFRTDGGKEFVAEVETLLKSWNVHREIGSLPDKPTAGERIERMMQLAGNGMRNILFRIWPAKKKTYGPASSRGVRNKKHTGQHPGGGCEIKNIRHHTQRTLECEKSFFA